MSRKLDIEITSVNGDAATWRAAGAKQPKGVVPTSLLGGEVSVGTVYRAEIEQFMEGVEVLSVAPPKSASPLDPRNERLAIKVPEHKGADVQVIYAQKGRNRRGDDEGRGRDDDRRGKGAGERSERRGPPKARTPRATTEGERPARDRSERAARPTGRPGAERRPSRPAGPVAPPVTTTFRNAFLATLSPEQLPVAEQLLRGGMPAVRQAVADQNRTATSQGRPTINAEVIDRIAEELLGRSNLAFWKDRAAGGLSVVKELRLRDLRAIVTSAKTVMLDDEGRAQLKELSTALTTRVEALRKEWTEKLDKAIEADDALEALRLSTRTPDPTTRVSSEAATKIAALASAALTAEASPSLWRQLVELAAESPMRRLIKPTGIPADEAARELAVKSAGSIPELAKLLGMKVPPPPPPSRSPRPARPPRTSRPSATRRSS
jgi:hypothetical protein